MWSKAVVLFNSTATTTKKKMEKKKKKKKQQQLSWNHFHWIFEVITPMKDEAIEICSFSKLTLKSVKLVYFFLSGSEVCVFSDLRTQNEVRRKLLDTLQISQIGFISKNMKLNVTEVIFRLIRVTSNFCAKICIC